MNKQDAVSLKCALLVLREVYRASRRLWPVSKDLETVVVKIDVAILKAQSLKQFHKDAADLVWVLAKQNEIEGSVKVINVKDDASALKRIQGTMVVVNVHQPLLVFDEPVVSVRGSSSVFPS
jgi:hypothetical protein